MCGTTGESTIYDYEHQAWVVDGQYVRCAHPESIECACYGREHAGEIADVAAILEGARA